MTISPYQVLNTLMNPDENDVGAETIREYLTALLAAVWREREDFSGKRPFGNSNWEGDLYKALVKEGYVEGKIDPEYGNLDEVDEPAADKLIAEAIEVLAAPVRPGDIIVAAERELIAAKQLQRMTIESQARYVDGKQQLLTAARRLQEPL